VKEQSHGKVEEEDHWKAEVEVEAKAAGKTEAKEKIEDKLNRKVEIMLLEMSIDSLDPMALTRVLMVLMLKKLLEINKIIAIQFEYLLKMIV